MKMFFDSSALAKRYIDEAGSGEVDRLCQRATALGVSIICIPEVISALCRLRREKKLTRKEYETAKTALATDIKDVIICGISETVIEQAITILERNPVRAMDALHVACARDWRAGLFVSADSRQLDAAKALGLKTVRV